MTDARLAAIRARLDAGFYIAAASAPTNADIAYLLGRLQEAETEAAVLRGLLQSARGETRSLGDFTEEDAQRD